MTDEELIAELRKPWFTNGCERYQLDAADRIEALVREKAAAYAQGYGDCEAEISLTEIGRTNEFLHGQIAKWKARAKRLEAAASSVADDVCSYICPSVGRAGEPILHDPHCIALRAALKGAEHE